MNIIFIACSPLAGAPIRIANALNKYTSYNVRCINLNPNCYGNRTFPEDLIWEKDRDECLEIICQADILHFHHYFDVESENNPFGIKFKKVAPDAKIVRHFHSELNFITQNNIELYNKILNDKYPKLVIPHCPERTFLDAYMVPNIIPISEDLLLPKNTENSLPKVFFSASSNGSMWDARWDTKGVPEVLEKFNSLKNKEKFEFHLIQNIPYSDCMDIKQKSDIVIGDTTSGSYHLTDLEALSQGKPTFTYLDGRSQMVLQSLLNCDYLPFVNARLEEIDLPFLELVKNVELRKEIGSLSRKWIEEYYNEQKLVEFYKIAYEKLLNNEPLKRQNNLQFKNAKCFLYNDLYNMQWETRIKNNYIKKQKNSFNNDKKREGDKMNILKEIFSVENLYNNDKKYKIIKILGFKIKLKIKDLSSKNYETLQIIEKNYNTTLEELATKLSMIDNTWQFNKTKVYVPNYPLEFIQKFIVNNNKYFEEDILKELDEYIPFNSTILDLGANIGNHTLYWLITSSKNVKKVHSFEPIKSTFNILKKNIEINGLEQKSTLYNIGLFNKNTDGEIKKYSIDNIGSTYLQEGNGNIVLKRLDDIQLNETQIDFIKIDVEGLELELLEGAQKTIQKFKPIIFIESWKENFDKMNEFFMENNYELVKIFPSQNYLYRYKETNN